MKTVRSAVALFLISVFLSSLAYASPPTSSVNPNIPAQGSPLSSSVLRTNFLAAYNDITTLFSDLVVGANQILGNTAAGQVVPITMPSCSTGTSALTWTSGSGFGCNSLSGGSGTVTSAGFTGDGTVFNTSVSGSPITTTGTFAPSLHTQSANLVLAGPSTGSAATPTFRALVGADLPSPGVSTLGGVESVAAVSHQFITAISTAGVPSQAQPAFPDISGVATLAQLPSIAANTVLGATSTGSPTALSLPSCSGGSNALIYTLGTGFSCNTITTGSLPLSSVTAATGSNSIENGANTQTWNFDSLTTGSALILSSTSATSGKILASAVANAASTGFAGYFSNTGTGAAYGVYSTEAGSANTGYAGYFNNTSTGGYALYVNGLSQFTEAAGATVATPSISTATFTPDGSTGLDFTINLVHASCPCTIANPANLPVGSSGMLWIIQSSTGSDTIGTWGSSFRFAGATKPTLTTSASAVDSFSYVVRDSTHIQIATYGLNFQ